MTKEERDIYEFCQRIYNLLLRCQIPGDEIRNANQLLGFAHYTVKRLGKQLETSDGNAD